jgi:general secretion pathway protein A
LGWLIGGREDRILWSDSVLPRLMEEMRAGYKRYAWGGVEIGGFFIGSREKAQVLVENFVITSCSHEHGPSFQLSAADKEQLRVSLDEVTRDGRKAVGWFHSVSNRQDLLTGEDEASFAEFFPETWQFALGIRRLKHGAPIPTLFVRSGSKLVSAAYAIVPLRKATARSAVEPQVAESASVLPREETPKPESAEPGNLAGKTPLPLQVPSATNFVATPPERREGANLGATQPTASDPGVPEAEFAPPTSDPFTLTPNPALFYPSKQHREAIEGLFNGIRTRKGFLLLSGESGMGKTMVLECLMDRLKQEKIEYGFIFNSRLAVGDLFEMLHADFGLETASLTKTSVLIALNNLLLKFAGEGKTVALLVDDAHQLNNEVLEEIELMSNLETRQGKLLQVVFAARPEFELRLGEVALRGLRSRVMRRFRLAPLTEEETAEFIRVRLRQKQGGVTLVPESVFGEIHTRSGGIPRIITALCGAAIERCRGNPRGGR